MSDSLLEKYPLRMANSIDCDTRSVVGCPNRCVRGRPGLVRVRGRRWQEERERARTIHPFRKTSNEQSGFYEPEGAPSSCYLDSGAIETDRLTLREREPCLLNSGLTAGASPPTPRGARTHRVVCQRLVSTDALGDGQYQGGEGWVARVLLDNCVARGFRFFVIRSSPAAR
jgi:hypothetical protein